METFLLHLCEICSHQCLDLSFEEMLGLAVTSTANTSIYSRNI